MEVLSEEQDKQSRQMSSALSGVRVSPTTCSPALCPAVMLVEEKVSEILLLQYAVHCVLT